jgi:hypothetical protein
MSAIDRVRCPCTTFEQDEDCTVGYPSMLCGACDGTGNAPIDKVIGLAAETLRIASDLGEPEDPFAVWESVSLIQSNNDKQRALIKALVKALTWGSPLVSRALEDVRVQRLQAGHSDIGTIRLGLWDEEVTGQEAIYAAIAAAKEFSQ